MAEMLARAQARAAGYDVDAPDGALDALCLDVLHRRVDYPGVQQSIAGWLKPRP